MKPEKVQKDEKSPNYVLKLTENLPVIPNTTNHLEDYEMIPDTNVLLTFAAYSAVLLLMPGPAIMYIIARSMEQGYKAGVYSVLGLSTGIFVHVIAATLGLSSILAASATAFGIVKYLGAAYLIFLGIKTLLKKQESDKVRFRMSSGERMAGVYLQGLVVNVLNPKLAMFFLALLPQFVDPAIGQPGSQMLFLGIMFTAMGIVGDMLYVVASGLVRRLVSRSWSVWKSTRYIGGVAYIGLGVWAALGGNNRR